MSKNIFIVCGINQRNYSGLQDIAFLIKGVTNGCSEGSVTIAKKKLLILSVHDIPSKLADTLYLGRRSPNRPYPTCNAFKMHPKTYLYNVIADWKMRLTFDQQNHH